MKPNRIGPPSFAKLKDGYAMLVFVSIILSLYIVGLVWARRKDRADVVKVSLTTEHFEIFLGEFPLFLCACVLILIEDILGSE